MASEKDKRSGLQKLQETAQKIKPEFYKDQFGKFVVVLGKRVYDIEDPIYKSQLSTAYYEEHGDVFGETTFNKHISLGIAEAISKEPKEFPRRICRKGNKIYYDTKEGVWEFNTGEFFVYTADDPDVPVIFRRYDDNKDAPLEPNEQTPKELIETIINQYNHDGLQWEYICSFFEPEHSHPIGLFNGEAGAAKSTLSQFIKDLVDPSIAGKISFPKDETGFDPYREKFYVCNYDNIRKITAEIADELCRQAMGSASVKRALYTNGGLYISIGKPRITLNGIKPEPSSFNDLLDRIYPVFMRKLHNNRDEEEVEREIKSLLPKMRFSCLKAVSLAIATPHKNIPDLPRMASFSILCQKLCELYGGSENEFIDKYKDKIKISHSAGLDDTFAAVLLEYINQHSNTVMEYSALEWYQKIKEWAQEMIVTEAEDKHGNTYGKQVFIRPEMEAIVKDKDFLKNPVAIGRRFRELNNILDTQGYNVEYKRTREKNIIEVKKK